MTPREIVLQQIRHQETPVIPYTLPYSEEVGTRLDNHYGKENWRGKIVEYMRHYDVMGFSWKEEIDEIHYRDLYGTIWRSDKKPSVVAKTALSAPSFENYDFPSAERFVVPELAADVTKDILKKPDVFSYVGVPCLWPSWYLRGFENTMMDIIAEEDFYIELLDRFTQLTLDSIERCSDIHADAIFMGDDWGIQRGIMIGPERWRKYYKPRYAKIFQAIRDQGKISLLHCCGSVYDIMDDIVEIGLDVLESVQPEAANMNPYELKRKWGDKISFWGGLGTQYTIPFGTPAEICAEIQNLRSEMSKGGGYILAPAKPLRPEVGTENAVAVLEEFTKA